MLFVDFNRKLFLLGSIDEHCELAVAQNPNAENPEIVLFIWNLVLHEFHYSIAMSESEQDTSLSETHRFT